MPKLLTHEDADKEVMQAMGNPSGESMDAFQRFMGNRGNANMPQLPNIPKLPKEQIRKLPPRTQGG